MKRLTILATFLLAALPCKAGGPGYAPTDAERARWTMGDMRSWAIALGAYKMDNGSYPETASLEELSAAVQNKYIRVVPMHDAWGTPYRCVSTKEGFRIVSAGADATFDETSWGVPSRELPSYADDAIIDQGGKMLYRNWKYE